MKLSLALIFKNEEAYLKQCLESVDGLVSEIIAVDSGSSDLSVEVIEMFNRNWKGDLKVLHRKWPGDFADQRNFALSKTTGDWILVLDADEMILKVDHAKILAAIARNDCDALNINIRNYTSDLTEWGYSRDPEGAFSDHGFVLTRLHRLFKRRNDFRYTGILHERIEPSLENANAKTKALEVVIHHFGKLKEKELSLQQERYRFYEELGKRKVEKERNGQAHWELGVIYQKQKRFLDAENEFKKAFQLEPQIPDFEDYYYLSLFQQGKWEALQNSEPRHRKGMVFKTIALAHRDSSKIEELDAFRKDLSQVHLFIFELSLKHHRIDRISRDREEAMTYFGSSGTVEFLEGAQARRDGDFTRAASLLELSYKKGWVRSLVDLLITWNQMEKFVEVLAFARALPREERVLWDSELKTILAYAEVQAARK